MQICGHKPDEMLVAAKAIEHMADAVDINLGCPQLIAKRGRCVVVVACSIARREAEHLQQAFATVIVLRLVAPSPRFVCTYRYGAFLLEEFDLLEQIVSTLSQNLNVPLTCKIRILPDFDRTLQLAKLLERSGCSLLTVHGRTKEEKGPKLRNSNWDWIRRIKDELSIPVVANGSIGRFEDVQVCFCTLWLCVVGKFGVDRLLHGSILEMCALCQSARVTNIHISCTCPHLGLH